MRQVILAPPLPFQRILIVPLDRPLPNFLELKAGAVAKFPVFPFVNIAWRRSHRGLNTCSWALQVDDWSDDYNWHHTCWWPCRQYVFRNIRRRTEIDRFHISLDFPNFRRSRPGFSRHDDPHRWCSLSEHHLGRRRHGVCGSKCPVRREYSRANQCCDRHQCDRQRMHLCPD
jgi:hypothetical protein